MTLYTKGQSALPTKPTLSQVDELLQEFFYHSLDAPSSFPTFVYALAIGGNERSAESIQFEHAQSDSDLDRISRHRQIRQALVQLHPHSLFLLTTHYTEDAKCDPPTRVALGSLRFLAPHTSEARQLDPDSCPQANLKTLLARHNDPIAIRALKTIQKASQTLLNELLQEVQERL